MRGCIAVFIGLTLAGCGGGPHSLNSEYAGAGGMLIQAENNDWLVVDKPDKSKMLVQRDTMIAANGRDRGALPRITYERAASAYLTKTGRTSCRINEGVEVMQQTWEFKYACDVGKKYRAD